MKKEVPGLIIQKGAEAIWTISLAELINDKMDLSIRMRIICNVKHRYAIRLRFGEKFLTFLTKLVFQRKASICSTIKENLLLYYKFSAFVVVVMI